MKKILIIFLLFSICSCGRKGPLKQNEADKKRPNFDKVIFEE
jgi:predicted small lipoprotein YifL